MVLACCQLDEVKSKFFFFRFFGQSFLADFSISYGWNGIQGPTSFKVLFFTFFNNGRRKIDVNSKSILVDIGLKIHFVKGKKRKVKKSTFVFD